MDKILIRGLKVTACHGVKDFEKVNPQPFVFDADIYGDVYAAAISDDIADTINYSAACKAIIKTAESNTYNLIEKLAYECAYAVINATNAQKITLTVYKPEAPVKANFDTVGFTAEVCRERVLLSLGSSKGDRESIIKGAEESLKKIPRTRLVRMSSVVETEPYGGVAQNKFLNCAAELETLLPPRALLNELQRVEAEYGRTRTVRWEDRTLDIDIVFFGKRIISEDGLIVPHPDYINRSFVLGPLKEIAPDFVCPLYKKPLKLL